MDDKRKTFTFLRSYFEAAKGLPDKHRLSLYDAILTYGFDDEVPELTDLANTYWILIEPVLKKSKMRAEFGSVGGKSKAEANALAKDKQTASKIYSKANSKAPAKTVAELDQMPKQSAKQNGSEYEYEYENEVDKTPLTPHGGDVGGKDERSPFELFWAAYPRKAGKGAALKAWSKIKPSPALIEKILQAVETAKASVEWRKENGQFIPHPATWLNQGRWDDELTTEGGARNDPDNGCFGRTDRPNGENWRDFKPSAGRKFEQHNPAADDEI